MKKIQGGKPFYKKWWFILIVIFLGIGILGSIGDNEEVGSSYNDETVQEEAAQEETNEDVKERPSEYGEDDRPFGEFNYKNAGIIKNLNKNLDDNYITATLTTDDKIDKKIKIYGTDMDISRYEAKKIFLDGVKNDSIDKDYILVSNYKNLELVDENLIDSINRLDNIDNTAAVNEVNNSINKINNSDYKNYIMGFYNDKTAALNKKKAEEQEQAKKQVDAQRQAPVNEEKKEAPINNNQGNTQTVYVAASGKGKCYHSDPNCSNMKGNINSMTVDQAKAKGLRPCKKCAH